MPMFLVANKPKLNEDNTHLEQYGQPASVKKTANLISYEEAQY